MADSGKKRLAARLVEGLREEYGDVTCALTHKNAFQLLIATILSAQCTDERVNLVTPVLFRRFPTAKDLAAAPIGEIEEIIQSTGFFRNKARNIQGCCRRLVEDFGGKLPRSLEELVTLPGVGRKTANVVLGTAYGIASGVVVDTHVQRISRRFGLTVEDTPEKIEQELMELLPRQEWIDYSHRVIHHGRRVCKARGPLCDECSLNRICRRVGVADA
jgi:endonuclease III